MDRIKKPARKWLDSVPDQATQRSIKTETIYKIAAIYFRKYGYHATSLTDIANELGLSKATLYHYVKNKQELLYQCHLVAAQEAIDCVCEDPALSGAEQLEHSLKRYIASVIDENSASVVVLEEKTLNKEQLEVVIKKRDEFDSKLKEIAQLGISDGSLRHVNVNMAIFTALGAANWTAKWYNPSGKFSPQEIAEEVTKIIFNGLKR